MSSFPAERDMKSGRNVNSIRSPQNPVSPQYNDRFAGDVLEDGNDAIGMEDILNHDDMND